MRKLITHFTATVTALIALTLSASVTYASTPPPGTPRGSGQCTQPVAYFDLGNVVIDSHDATKLSYTPEAENYLKLVHMRKIPMGLIVNIPAEWGATDQERIAKLKEFVAAGWIDDTPFDWSYFEGRIFVPRTNAERKPAPAMFERSRDLDAPCPLVYQGEVAAEIETAKSVGFRTYLAGVPGMPFFLPINEL